jgi:hypothetical protein
MDLSFRNRLEIVRIGVPSAGRRGRAAHPG